MVLRWMRTLLRVVMTLLPDAFRVGGWLSVVGLGLAQPGWVDGLVCADESISPEPLPMHAMCVCVVVY